MTHRNRERWRHWQGILGFALAAGLMTIPTLAQDPAKLKTGRDVWNDGACANCHGPKGQGGVSIDFPAGPSLRTTNLTREALVEATRCGRPETKMPAWLKGAYTEYPCYGRDLGPAPEGLVVVGAFRAEQIEALVDYITTQLVVKSK